MGDVRIPPAVQTNSDGKLHSQHRQRWVSLLTVTTIVIALVLVAFGILYAMGARDTRQPEVVVLTCMDHRLVHHVAGILNARGLQGRWDQLVLAGASLGVTQTLHPEWGQTFWTHLALSMDLHAVHTLIIVDHMHCGAAHLLFPDTRHDRAAERAVHRSSMTDLADAVRTQFPSLRVETMLIDISGKVLHTD